MKRKINLHNLPEHLEKELKATYGLLGKERKPEPNPFLFTRIQEAINEIESSRKTTWYTVPVRKISIHALFTLALIASVFGSIKLGNHYHPGGSHPQSYSTEYFLNDLEQEKLEISLIRSEQ